MFKNKYEADNSRFGEVLTQVLSAHGIGVRQFLAEAKVGKTRFYAIKRGQGDYSLSTYVRMVSGVSSSSTKRSCCGCRKHSSRPHLRQFIAKEIGVSQTTYERGVAFLYLCMAN